MSSDIFFYLSYFKKIIFNLINDKKGFKKMKKVYYVYNMTTKKDICMTDEFNHAYQLKKEFEVFFNNY